MRTQNKTTIYGVVLWLVMATALVARGRLAEASHYFAAVAAEVAVAPDGPPVPGQAAIDFAVSLYSIEVPAATKRPVYDGSLTDRGSTRLSMYGPAEVTIGPAAFASWSLLGSTLAHELEVHAKQNFLVITCLDFLGLEGTERAEREAYRHELAMALRFGLSAAEQEDIAELLETFYGEGSDPLPDSAGKDASGENAGHVVRKVREAASSGFL